MKITQKMVDYCRDMGDGVIKPANTYVGLCENFCKIFNKNLEKILNFTKYPNFSGNYVYPIKSFNPACNPETKYHSIKNKWDKRTKYTKERYKFCLWCADELERLMIKQEAVK